MERRTERGARRCAAAREVRWCSDRVHTCTSRSSTLSWTSEEAAMRAASWTATGGLARAARPAGESARVTAIAVTWESLP